MSLTARITALAQAIGAEIKSIRADLATVRHYNVYSWKADHSLALWTSYSATVSNPDNALRFTNNTAGAGDAAVTIRVQAGVRYMIRGDVKALGPGATVQPVMHIGSRAAPWGGYGFDYPMGQGHPIVATDDRIVVYVSVENAGLGTWVELSDISVTEVPLQ